MIHLLRFSSSHSSSFFEPSEVAIIVSLLLLAVCENQVIAKGALVLTLGPLCSMTNSNCFVAERD
jgi:hypothetical protein